MLGGPVSAQGCADYYVKDCPCPAGCDQTFCQKLCKLATPTRPCSYECPDECDCAAYGIAVSDSRLIRFGMLIGAAFVANCAAEEKPKPRTPEYSRQKLPDGAESIRTPYGEYVVVADKDTGSTGGIGVQISQFGSDFVFARVFSGSPAAKAGIKSGDVLRAISDQHGSKIKTDSMALSDVVSHLRGKAGTKISVQVLRPKSGKVLDVSVWRSASAFSGAVSKSSTWRTIPLAEVDATTCPERWRECYLIRPDQDACHYSCPQAK